MSSIPRPSVLRVGTTPPASPAPTNGAAPQARARDEGPAHGPRGEPARAPDVRWTPAGDGDARTMRETAPYGGARAGGANNAGGAGGVGGVMSDAWGTHIETLGRWCRSDWPLSATGRSAAASLALALGLRLGAAGGGNGRGALGEVVRLLLAAAEADVATLRTALTDHRAPGSRTLLARIVGAPWLLATVRLRGGTVEGTELRACVSREEAAALLTALAGAANEGSVPALRAIVTGWVRGATRDAPLLGEGGDEVPLAGADETQLLVLPLLALDGAVPAEPPAAVLAAMGGLAAPRVASPFLDDADPRAVGLPERDQPADEDVEDEAPADTDEDEDEDEDEDASDDETAIAAPAAPAAPTATEPVEAEAMTAALARLRARHTTVQHVEASIASDDGVVEHVADVVPWLAEASTVEIRALARDGWAGEEAIEVARAMADDDPEIAEVVRHARRTEGELVVEIDGRAASAWLRANRPDLARKLDDVLEDEPDDA